MSVYVCESFDCVVFLAKQHKQLYRIVTNPVLMP